LDVGGDEQLRVRPVMPSAVSQEGVAPPRCVFCGLSLASMIRKPKSGEWRIGSRNRHLLAQE
jgi:hypothetical protein